MEFLNQNRINTLTTLSFTAQYLPGTLTSITTSSELIDNDINSPFTYILNSFTTTGVLSLSFQVRDYEIVDDNIFYIINHNLGDIADYYTGSYNYSSTSGSGGGTLFSNSITTTNDSIRLEVSNPTPIGIGNIVDALTINLNFYFNTTRNAQTLTIGEIIYTQRLLNFERNPSFQDYAPIIYGKQVRHEMANGGVVLYKIQEKFRAKIAWKYISNDFRQDLFNIYQTADDFYFVPYPELGTLILSSTGSYLTSLRTFDGQIYDVVMTGNFDFKPADNNFNSVGYSGSIMLEEIP